MPGPVPKPESKRRRANKPRSYGDAEATTAPAAQSVADRQLGIQNAHPLIASIWDTVQSSCESAFYSESDWARLRMELWFANHTMASGRPSGQAWAVIQDGMNAMLISPAVKRRAGIELRPSAVDEDENAAVPMIDRYRQMLKPV